MLDLHIKNGSNIRGKRGLSRLQVSGLAMVIDCSSPAQIHEYVLKGVLY